MAMMREFRRFLSTVDLPVLHTLDSPEPFCAENEGVHKVCSLMSGVPDCEQVECQYTLSVCCT